MRAVNFPRGNCWVGARKVISLSSSSSFSSSFPRQRRDVLPEQNYAVGPLGANVLVGRVTSFVAVAVVPINGSSLSMLNAPRPIATSLLNPFSRNYDRGDFAGRENRTRVPVTDSCPVCISLFIGTEMKLCNGKAVCDN